MSARNIVGGLAEAAIGAVKHPVGTAEEAISKARTAVGAGTAVGTAVASTVIRRVRGDAKDVAAKAGAKSDEVKDRAGDATESAVGVAKESVKDPVGKVKATSAKAAGAAKSTAEKAAKKSAAKKSTAKKSTAKKSPATTSAKREPQVVLAEPAPPAEPPVDVVGEALAAEEQESRFGRTTEPRGASRDEEHGEAALQRAEVDEIAEEMAEVAKAGNLDLATPVGTTGADTGFNPDTAEADLQQPGTEPLLDPSLTKEVKAEQETLRQAAEPRKAKPKKKS